MDEFSPQKASPKISLADLMRNAGSSVQSAESTAQRLLQFIATQYSGVESTEDISNTSTVRLIILALVGTVETLIMDTPKSGQPPYNGHTVCPLPI